MSAKQFAKDVLTELADPHGTRRGHDEEVRRAVAARIAAAIAEIDPKGLTAEQMQRLAVEAAKSQGAQL